ncbi:UvrB/UvrC motif-containing protein [Kribbella steppae]|uniref:UvrB/UvrC motif-containing protein n=1 Tax=Kribbella steppae TaxID=2512223 RepID=A0A4V2S0F4_9ACTN|nr:P-loop NTPase fold protein [Kribbella steppae]TCO32410.1 UvrB/UvrC motif-containing protein [Kribbella steppae]
MFERFTDRARAVVVLAQEEAREYRHDHIGTEHVLLGLVREGEGVGAKTLESLGVSLDAVRSQIEEVVGVGDDGPGAHIPFTPRAKRVLEFALREALQLDHNYIGTEHILLGLLRENEGVAAQVLVKLGADLNTARAKVIELLSGRPVPGAAEVVTLELDKLGQNLTSLAREGKLYPVIGREREVERTLQVLSRRTRNNPCLVGEPGINKHAIVEGIAQLIVRRDVPEILRGKQIYALDAESLLTTAIDKADTVAKLHSALREAADRGDVIVFVDELHVLLRAGATSGVDTAAVLRPALLDGSLQVVGGMTLDDYSNYLENDNLLGGLFQAITVAESSVAWTIESLKGVREQFEAHHRVTITDSALVAAVVLAHKYMTHQFLPDSAIDLIDEAGARLRIRRMTQPPDLRDLDEEIAAIRRQKEEAIDAQDFELASSLRDEEKAIRGRKAERERQWKDGDIDLVAEVDEDLIVEIVSEASRTAIAKIVSTDEPEPGQAVVPVVTGDRYVLIGDRPAEDELDDLLGTSAVAGDIAAILAASRESTPFVLAVDGGWGVGKSTLLHHIDARLPGPPEMVKVRFNAWTAQGGNALEGLIKSVLVELDSNLIRRSIRKLARRKRVVGVARIGSLVLARFLGASRLVDELMSRMAVDSQSRNELRDLIHGLLSDWVGADGKRKGNRTLVVFIDDLDRCDDAVVLGVCEAVKLYLDAPGLIFVIGCDLSVLARGVSGAARGGLSEGRTYLEKIVQVAYRVPAPDHERVRRLIRGYADRSGTTALVDDTVIELLAERTGRNPRRIKRIINSFVLEYRLNPAWRQPPLGSAQLITVILLHQLYPSFYERLVSEDSGADPILEFLDYADVQAKGSNPPPAGDPWWSTVSRTFRAQGLRAPDRSAAERHRLAAHLEQLEQRLPDDYPSLARNQAFVDLLAGIGGTEARQAIRSQLISRPLGTNPLAGSEAATAESA